MIDDISNDLDDWFTHGESMTDTRRALTRIVERIEEEHAQYVLDWNECGCVADRMTVGSLHSKRRKRLIDELEQLMEQT